MTRLRSRRSRWTAALVLAVGALTLATAAPGADEAGAPAPSIADVAWIAGSWEGAIGDDPIAELWLPPAGGEMAGVFRWIKGGEVYLYELLSIEPEAKGGGGLVLKIKHFGPGLVGWEEKDEAVVFDLVEMGEGTAVFVKRSEEQPSRMTYRRSGEDGMSITMLDLRNGNPVEQVFRYRRVD